ncbi:hypothetical protein BY458DRAFT_439511 [Sporodiniella umbellata]|nr:hypothetical protein BY458DRAFT_439511 [Sporodiniella umbellata]
MFIEFEPFEPYGKGILKNRQFLVGDTDPGSAPPDSSVYMFSSALISHRIIDTSDALGLDQEVYVYEKTVVWSRGGHVVQIMDFSSEKQCIQEIVFAQFLWPSDKKEIHRALCIVFRNMIRVCREDAPSITCHLPFDIGQVTPLDIGLILSKKYPLEPTRKAPLTLSESSIVTITNPLRDACSVRFENMRRKDLVVSPLQTVLFATAEASKTGRLPIIVTRGAKDNKHYVWTYERLKSEESDSPSKPTLQPKRKRSADPIPSSIKRKRSNISYKNKEELFSESVSPEESVVDEDIPFAILDSSEISIRLLWKETFDKKSATKLKQASSIRSDAFLVHSLSGEELICIMNYPLESLQLVNLDKADYSANQCIEFKACAKGAIPVYATRDKYIDLLILDSHSNLQLLIDTHLNAKMAIPSLPSATPTEILYPVHERFTVQYSNGQSRRYTLNLRPKSTLVRDCLVAIDCGSTNSFPMIWTRYLELNFLSSVDTDMNEWALFTITLLSFLKLKRCLVTKASGDEARQPIPSQWIEQAFQERDKELKKYKDLTSLSMMALVEIVHSLHVVYEDYRIKKSTMRHANPLGYLLIQLCSILNSKEWVSYYRNQGFDTKWVHPLEFMNGEVREIFSEPLNFQTCLKRMINNTVPKPTLLRFLGVNALEPTLFHYTDTYARTLKKLWPIYGVMKDQIGDEEAVMRRIVDEGITRQDIEMMNEEIASLLLEVLNRLKTNPSLGWSVDYYKLIERNDIYEQLEIKTKKCDPNTDRLKLSFFENYEARMGMNDFIKNLDPVRTCAYESDRLNNEIERLRFGFDRSIEKVRVMLDATRVPDRFVPERSDLSDDALAEKHQEQVLLVAQRTIALATGRGIFAFGTHVPDLTLDLPTETMTLSAKIQPLCTVVQLEDDSIPIEVLVWPKFHNGVATGLRISPSSDVDESWINYCFPKDLTVEHGGTLLGMGLVGILKKLPVEHWVRFITHTCEPVSIGFLLGVGVSYMGTQHLNVIKILAVHIPSLIEETDDDFEHSNQIMATSILGMGLVYMQSCDRLMLSAMIQELCKNTYTNPSLLESDYGVRSLAAGFSIGFIALGAGGQRNLEDLELRNTLYKLLSGRDGGSLQPPSPAHEHGATLALGLMYLKTENKVVADHIELPESKLYLKIIRPDLLLIRTIAKNLIMWSTICPTEEWVDEQIPYFLRTPSGGMNQESVKQAKYNIIAGACLCLGLRYAGSQDERALQVLLARLDLFIRLAQAIDATPQEAVTKNTVRACISVLCTSAAMVAAGSGNPRVLRILQKLYDTLTSNTSYGSHMALSMSLGLLFVGLGGYTLKTTNQSIAALLCAFYPFYPTDAQDNDWHLQTFRHLWVVALDSRWLLAVDVDLKKPCTVPLQLEMYDDQCKEVSKRSLRQVRVEAPVVVPDYSLIKSIQIMDHQYWPLYIDAASNQYRDSIMNSGIIYVKKRKSSPRLKEVNDDLTAGFV